MTTEEKCENCRYYIEWDAKGGHGACIRFPPAVIMDTQTNYNDDVVSYPRYTNPTVGASDFCGEFKEKKV